MGDRPLSRRLTIVTVGATMTLLALTFATLTSAMA
jgi:hypothetical protein